ncbi:zinc finger MYM-type protein 1-like [Salvia splendens]|uniref:zinc finger MYM-type protein 1-like n=1 Tax=Salvia splendens TaxID=180675 RepID=UPI001C260847|nr:zinc finger MYM-type protein 1-like [Salvia splendens]
MQSGGSSSSSSARIVELVENQSAIEVELDWNDIDADPGKRKSIEAFDVAIRDRVRREYLVKGPCQPIGNTYPKKKYEKFNQHVGAANSCHNNARIQFEAFQDQWHSVANVFRGLPFRGHDESSSSSNLGNFLELLQWLGQHNVDVSKVLGTNAPANNQMTSPRIQKELANACASEVTLAIVKDIGDRVFSILVDEARDVSLKEQMGVVLRYVNSEGYVIERFLGIVHVTDTCSRYLKNAIDALLAKHNLSLSRVRSQGYDGASNMRGEFNGLKSLILQENPYAMYIHCFSHQLQLIIVAITKGVRVVKDSFNYISMIVNMVGASCKRKDQLRKLQHERLVAQLNDEEVTSGRGQNQETTLVVDLIIQEMNNRFSEASTDLLKFIACLDPRNSFSEFNENQVIHIATLYPEDFSVSECLHLPRQVSNFIVNVRCDPQFVALSDLGSFAMKMVKTKKHLVFPLVYRIIELALVLPVATASVERAFSAMKTIKTDLRNRMGDEWMNDSLVVYIEKDIFSTIDNEPILQRFQSMKTRRIQLPPL